MKTKSTLLLTALSMAASVFVVSAQDAPPPPPAGGPGGPGGQDFRQRMADRLKTALKASDEEWAVIQPLMEKIQTKAREAGEGGRGGMGGPGGGGRGQRGGGPGGPGGPGGGGPGGPGGGPGGQGGGRGQRGGGQMGGGATAEAQALRTTLQNENAAPAELQAKLSALREQRKKAQAELTQAREDLRKVLTLRQEATLVLMNVLE
jgi:outer membrane murein-binding lipoprotein Lpp